MNVIIPDMATTKKAPVKKTAAKPADWIKTATAKEAGTGRAQRLVKKDDLPVDPKTVTGTTFRYEVSGGAGQVVMAARIPTSRSRDSQFSLPPTLKRQLRDATGEQNWSSAVVALADYALDVLEKTPGAWIIEPDSNASGEGKVCSRMTMAPARKLSLTLAAPLPGWHKKGRRRIGVPEDIRARVNVYIAEGSFTGVLLGLTQFALEHLRKKKKRLLVLPC